MTIAPHALVGTAPASNTAEDDPIPAASVGEAGTVEHGRGISSDPRDQAESMLRAAARAARDEAGLDGTVPVGELWLSSSYGVSLPDGDTWDSWVESAGAERLGGTVVARESSGLIALCSAARAIAEGRTDRAIVVDVDVLHPLLLRALRRLRALAPCCDGIPPVARPFDRHRRGTVVAEGATAIVLEREGAARDRAASVRSRFGAIHIDHDDTSPPYGFGSAGAALGERLRAHLESEGIRLATIDGVISGARGSIEGDAQEAHWIAALFGEGRTPPVFAPIGTTGLGGGGFLAAAALAAEGSPLGGSSGFCERDPALPVRPHPGAVSPTPGRILVSTLASGGQAIYVLLDAP